MDFNRVKIIPAILPLLIAAGPVWGDVAAQSSRGVQPNKIRTKNDSLILAASISQGVTSLSSTSSEASGSLTQVLGLVSWLNSDWIFEGGGGFLTAKTKGRSGASSSGLSLTDYEMTHHAGVLEFSPQHRFTDRIQAGPMMEFLFGEDVGFKAGIGYSGKTTAWLSGGQALYSFIYGPTRIRAGVQYLTSLDLENKRLQSIQATLQFGFSVL